MFLKTIVKSIILICFEREFFFLKGGVSEMVVLDFDMEDIDYSAYIHNNLIKNRKVREDCNSSNGVEIYDASAGDVLEYSIE